MNGYGEFLFPTGDGGVLVHEPRTEVLQDSCFVCCDSNDGRTADNYALLLLILLLLSAPEKSNGSCGTAQSDGVAVSEKPDKNG